MAKKINIYIFVNKNEGSIYFFAQAIFVLPHTCGKLILTIYFSFHNY